MIKRSGGGLKPARRDRALRYSRISAQATYDCTNWRRVNDIPFAIVNVVSKITDTIVRAARLLKRRLETCGVALLSLSSRGRMPSTMTRAVALIPRAAERGCRRILALSDVVTHTHQHRVKRGGCAGGSLPRSNYRRRQTSSGGATPPIFHLSADAT